MMNMLSSGEETFSSKLFFSFLFFTSEQVKNGCLIGEK